MKNYIYIFFLILVTIMIYINNNILDTKQKLQKQIVEIHSLSIIFNVNDFHKIEGYSPKKIKCPRYSFIIYVDSMSCTDCILKTLDKWTTYLETLHNENIAFNPIFAPSSRTLKSFIYKAKAVKVPYNIYIDSTFILEKNNPSIFHNKFLHTFMLDSANNILVVGNPTQNIKVKYLINNILQKN